VGGSGAPSAKTEAGPPRQDHGLGRKSAQELGRNRVEGVDLAINAQLAKAAGDQLRDLAAEVDDQQALVVRGGDLGRVKGHGAGLRTKGEAAQAARMSLLGAKGRILLPGGPAAPV
jgi:hypothetical protein